MGSEQRQAFCYFFNNVAVHKLMPNPNQINICVSLTVFYIWKHLFLRNKNELKKNQDHIRSTKENIYMLPGKFEYTPPHPVCNFIVLEINPHYIFQGIGCGKR